MRNAVLTHRPESFAPVMERVARTAREEKRRRPPSILLAVERLDAAEPGRLFTPEDVVADLAAHGLVRQLQSVDNWLRQETLVGSGRVVRMATRVYKARSGPGDGSVSPAQRVRSAALELERLGSREVSVQDLLAQVNAGGAELSQRSVYYGVRLLLDDGQLVRASWGRYALATGTPGADGEGPEDGRAGRG